MVKYINWTEKLYPRRVGIAGAWLWACLLNLIQPIKLANKKWLPYIRAERENKDYFNKFIWKCNEFVRYYAKKYTTEQSFLNNIT